MHKKNLRLDSVLVRRFKGIALHKDIRYQDLFMTLLPTLGDLSQFKFQGIIHDPDTQLVFDVSTDVNKAIKIIKCNTDINEIDIYSELITKMVNNHHEFLLTCNGWDIKTRKELGR